MDASNSMVGSRRISLGKRAAFAVVPLLVLLTLAELTARCFVSDAMLAKRFEQIEQIIVFLGNEPGQSIFQPDRDCFWRLKPNAVAPFDRGQTWGGVMSNSHGLRSREVSVTDASQRARVLCFGDSTTFAFGVDFNDAWPNQLQVLLDSEQPSAVEVLNAGIPGHTSFQGRQRLAADLEKWRPHLTVITFGNNDGWRWDDCTDKDHAVRSASPTTDWMNHSRAFSWLRSCRMQTTHQQAARDESRWAEQATLNYFDPNLNWTPRVSLDDFAENLRAMIAMCRAHNSEVVLIVWPDQRQLLNQPTWRLRYQAVTRQVADETSVTTVDLVPPFQRFGRWGANRFLPGDVIHVDRAGNLLVAKAVAQHVRQLLHRSDVAQSAHVETR